MMNLREHFGEIDIYLFDQLLKGRFAPGTSILDAGCGAGRNLVYFLQNGYEVYGVDQNREAVEPPAKTMKISQCPSLKFSSFVYATQEAKLGHY